MNTEHEFDLSRRRTLAAGGTMMAGLIAGMPDLASGQTTTTAAPPTTGTLPVQAIQRILRTTGTVKGKVLNIEQLRRDLNNVVGPADIPFKPAFQVHHDFYFQEIANGRAILNGELALRASEINAVIDRILQTGLVFQSFHQHFFDLEPQIWHVHLRGTGNPYTLAYALEYIVRATGTPLPQTLPRNPSSTLDEARLGRLLGGDVEVHEQGIVSVSIPRRESITLGGVAIDPGLGVSHEIYFEPLQDGRTACAPDVALLAQEVNPVCRSLRRDGFDVHCLYNQETAEVPQLYFSHLLAVGNAYNLARAIRRALQQTNTRFM